MKKIILIAVVLLLLCSCTNLGGKTDAISSEQATQIVQELFKTHKGKMVEYDGKETINDNLYFRIHVYSLGPKEIDEEGKEFQMTYTHIWLYVDSITGNVFSQDLEQKDKMALKPYDTIS